MSSLVLTTALLLMAPPPALAMAIPEPPVLVPPMLVPPVLVPPVLVPNAEMQAAAPPPAPVALSAPPQPAGPQIPATPETIQTNEDDEIVVTGRRHDPADPFEQINAESFAITQAVDTAIIRPVAKTYQRILPAPARDGIRNFLENLREPVIFLNFLLQHKVGKAVGTFGRFALNSTVGVGGLVDVARRKPFKLAHRPNGFADTLGFYGVKTGVFLFLPIIGPTTVRDLIGSTVDRFILPFAVGGPFRNPAVTIPMGVFGTLDHRAQFDETLEQLHRDTPDAYVASREFYLARRQAEIDALRGKGHRVVRPDSGSVEPVILDPAERR